MLNADFFLNCLPRLISVKAVHSPDGSISVELRLYPDGKYMVNSIVEAGDAAVVLDVYREDRRERIRKQNETLVHLDTILIELVIPHEDTLKKFLLQRAE